MIKALVNKLNLSFLIFFGSLSVISQTIAMQEDPEQRMNAVIQKQYSFIQQENDIKIQIQAKDDLLRGHFPPDHDCQGQSPLCDQDTPECLLSQYQQQKVSLTMSLSAIEQQTQEHQQLFETMLKFRNALQELREEENKVNDLLRGHFPPDHDCQGQSLLCDQNTSGCLLSQYQESIFLIQYKIQQKRENLQEILSTCL